MFNDCFNLKIGWMVSMYIAVVPLGFDMAYPAELQNLCAAEREREREREAASSMTLCPSSCRMSNSDLAPFPHNSILFKRAATPPNVE